MSVLESLLQSIRKAASFNSHELAAPRVILWPDEERSWAHCISTLRASHPALWSLGDFSPAPDQSTGPAAWLRFQLETYTGDEVPALYLPGIGRSAFRSADQCPKPATHLFALQFQGQFWTQKNGKDWTPFAFLSNKEGGLGLDVAGDQETKTAIQECLQALLHVELDALHSGKLEASDFRALVTKDPAKTLLRWMSNPAQVQQELQSAGVEWSSFRAICRDTYGFDPEKQGAITAVENLTSDKPIWMSVWDRYTEAPRAYPGVQELLESQKPVSLLNTTDYFPKANREEESRLEAALLALGTVSPKEALGQIQELAVKHAARAQNVWATLGESPLATAVGHLRDLAAVVQTSGNPSSWESLASYYSGTGWKVDSSVLKALDVARSSAATKAVTAAIRAVYLPWLDKFSALAQSLAASYPNRGPETCRSLPAETGTVYLFADGLRMDLARGLEARLVAAGNHVTFDHAWTALPSVTATAKPAWQPLAGKLGGPLVGTGFQAQEQDNGKALVHARFKQLLTELGISFLGSSELGPFENCAWTEFGSFDKYGHAQGAKLAWRVDEELDGLQQRVAELLHAGWAKVKVVTDHGWLVLPGGLPKSVLLKHLTGTLWGRCAIPDPGAQHGYPMTSWFWDNAEAVVLAPGVSCFVEGMEYAHGGLTLQEALIPSLMVTASSTGDAKSVTLRELKWLGMRLNVVLEGAHGLTIDVRTEVADAATSLAQCTVTAAADGKKTSLIMQVDVDPGTAAFLAVVDPTGQTIFKQPVVIGEN